ncbi:protein-glutamate O-methyltransferase CheR [Aquisalimonas sp.]|uniref:CheR family methyltransferase n=1 Tax=unclassified Aquisalimonas TaxID=2644645 RepID=UPI0025C7164D|nr:protein-glutamate O-methyltransferase CheR [Aquisalimonas sp.]
MAADAPREATEVPGIGYEDFTRFREFYYRKTGNWFEENKRYYVDKRLLARMRATGCGTFREYFVRLRFETDGAELQELVNSMTVNETYFFREEYQFQCLVRSMLPRVVKRKKPGETVRIWSLPCSTGEEVYSLALYLLEYWDDVDDYNVELIGSDIDTRALEKANQGIYEGRALHALPGPLLKRYFRRLPDGSHQILKSIRDSIRISRVNLQDPLETRPYRGFDVVFCRNLLIYFDDAARRRAAETLYDALNPGGYICLGHSEFMSRISSLFKPARFPEAIVYQRPEEDQT